MSENIERQVDAIILKKWQLIVGVLGFLITFVAPLIVFGVRLDKNQALQAQSIQTIQLNHEAHIQSALEKIADGEEERNELRTQILTNHDAIIRLLQMHESYE